MVPTTTSPPSTRSDSRTTEALDIRARATTAQPSRARTVCVIVLLLASSTALTLAMLEAALRALVGFLPGPVRQVVQATPGHFGVAHPYIGHLHRPHHRVVVEGADFRAVHDTDGHGFRNPWPWPERADVVVVGDSMTYGYGVDADAAWPSLLRHGLRGRDVVNLGLIGAGPEQYRRVYEVFGVPLRPKVLLVGLFAGNDFQDTRFFDAWLRSNISGNYMFWRDSGRRTPNGTGGIARFKQAVESAYAVARHIYLFNLVHHIWRSFANRTGEATTYDFPDGTSVVLFPEDFDGKTAGSATTRREYSLALAALRRLAEQAERNGTTVVIVLQPSKEEVHLPLLGLSARDPARTLRQAFDESGIRYIDLAPVFAAEARRGRRLFFMKDGHPNADGYALIAETVQRDLLTHGLLDDGASSRVRAETSASR